MYRTSDVKVRDRNLSHLKPILWDWVEIAKEWSKRNGDDAVWWYNERASLSALAGAIWRGRGAVLEELSNPKKRRLRSGKLALQVGRADMVFTVDEKDYVLEAKQCWLSAKSNSVPSVIAEMLRRAKRDAVRASSYGAQRLGAVFISPWVSTSENGRVMSLMAELIETIEKKVAYGAMAYVFPKAARNLVWRPERALYPGAVLLLRSPRE